MENEEQLIKKRFTELSNRAYNNGTWEYSDFLNINEQNLLLSAVKRDVTLFGGTESAERRVACFGNEGELGYPSMPPIKCVEVSPLLKKFSDDLTHRDFLGSLLALGIKREKVGDIIISDNTAYVFCIDSIVDFILLNLTKVKHTNVKCKTTESIPKAALPEPENKTVIVASERLDAAVSAVYNFSRSESFELFRAKKIFVNSRLCENNSHILSAGDVVSVRGFGRFVWLGVRGETKKGRLHAEVGIY